MPSSYIFGNIRLLSASVMNVGGVQIGLWLCWQILTVVQFIPLEEDQQPNLTRALGQCGSVLGWQAMLSPQPCRLSNLAARA